MPCKVFCQPRGKPSWRGSPQFVLHPEFWAGETLHEATRMRWTVVGLIILAVEVTGTSVKTSRDRFRRFLELTRATMVRSQEPVTLATEER